MGLFIGTKEELAASRKKKGRSKGGKAFDKEFARQKASGAKNFKFGGKSYSTKTASGGAAKSTMAAVKPKGASGPTALAKKTTVLPKPAPRSGLPNKAPIPGKRPEGAAAAVKSVPIPTPRPSTVRRPGSPDGPRGSQHSASEGDRNPTTARPDNVGNVPPPKSRPPVYFGPDMKRGVEERKIATNKAMQSAQQRTKDIAAKRQFVRNQPPAPSKFAGPPSKFAAQSAADVGDTRKRMDLVTKSPSPRGTRITHASVKQADRPANVGNTPSVPKGKLPLTPPSIKPISSAAPAQSTFTRQQKLDAAMAKAKARSAQADAKARAAQPATAVAAVKRPAAGVERGGYTRPKLKLGIWRN